MLRFMLALLLVGCAVEVEDTREAAADLESPPVCVSPDEDGFVLRHLDTDHEDLCNVEGSGLTFVGECACALDCPFAYDPAHPQRVYSRSCSFTRVGDLTFRGCCGVVWQDTVPLNAETPER